MKYRLQKIIPVRFSGSYIFPDGRYACGWWMWRGKCYRVRWTKDA